jgi:hypothetical protein
MFNFIAHIVAIAAPIVAEIPAPYPFVVILISFLIGGVSSMFVREVDNKEQE